MSVANEPEKRQCPTRRDGGDALICHWIDPATCQRRQRQHYHKCHTCVHQNAQGASPVRAGLPPREAPAPRPREASPAPLRVPRAGEVAAPAAVGAKRAPRRVGA